MSDRNGFGSEEAEEALLKAQAEAWEEAERVSRELGEYKEFVEAVDALLKKWGV